MKIAFVGKGGSGKSTISSIFIQYLLREKISLIGIDADININLFPDLGIKTDKKKALSSKENEKLIRHYLLGNNKLIAEVKNFVKTTPPGTGSNLIVLDNNYVLNNFSEKMGSGYFMFVGTYEEENIGKSCYHNNLSILENIISHTYLKDNEFMVADMVAGTDSFSNSLHSQFDIIYLIVEPTPESLSVANDFIRLSEFAGTLNNIRLIGNKIESQEDIEYITQNTKLPLFNHFSYSKKLKQSRQLGKNVVLEVFDNEELENLNQMYLLKNNIKIDYNNKLAMLHKLHLVYSSQEYVKRRLGDISAQIDKQFNYEKEIYENKQ